jgi:hypothetical protein
MSTIPFYPIKGSNVLVFIDGDYYAGIVSDGISFKTNMDEVIRYGGKWKEFQPGKNEASIGISMLASPTQIINLTSKLFSGVSVTVTYDIDDEAVLWQMTGYISDYSLSAPMNAAATVELTIVISGAPIEI